MTYYVVLHRLAAADLRHVYRRAARHAPGAAFKWLNRFHQSLQTLEHNPQRCPLARENAKVSIELRELLFGRKPWVFRVLYTIDRDTVRVLRIRRAQRRFLTATQIQDALEAGD